MRAWLAVAVMVIGAAIAGCSGGGHSSLPATPSSSIQNLSGSSVGSAPPGALAIRVQLPATSALASFSQRSPQYVSGQTQGVYITGTCLTGGGTVTQNCSGAAFPAVYADVSSGSPLCSGSPRVCTLNAGPVPGYSYAITVALLDKTPTGENLTTGYGTGFPTTAKMLAVGSNPNPMPAATGSPGPSPTPTALGARINSGTPNNVTIFLNAIATQFLIVDPVTGGAENPVGSLTDNTIVATANGTYQGLSWFFSAGDADGNLIASPTCMDTYSGEVGSGGGATIAGPAFPTIIATAPSCDGWAGPDGKRYAVTVTSSLPTHVCTVAGYYVELGGPTPPPCTTAGTSPTIYSNADFAPLSTTYGVWTQDPPGVTDTYTSFWWDGIADNDTACSGATPKCGVPIALALSNNIPTSAIPLVGKTSSYNVTNAGQFYLAPFVTTVSCGSNTSCFAATTASYCTGYCTQIALNNNGTATVTAFLYGSGGTSNLAAGTGCYTSACFSVAVNGSPPVNESQCYTGINPFIGVSVPASIGCSDFPDTGTVAGAQPAGTVDCQEPLGASNGGAIVALIKPGTFTKGALAPPGVADSMTFTVQAVAGPTTGYCNFQIVDANRTPPKYSLTVFVQVASNSTIIGVPPGQQLGSAPSFLPNDCHFGIAATCNGQVDPKANQQWDMYQVSAPSAWELVTQGVLRPATVKIAIIDTGWDCTHASANDDLTANVQYEAAYYNGNGTLNGGDGPALSTAFSCAAEDTDGHGTNVTGIADAVTNNSLGFAGLAFNAQLYEYRVFPSGVNQSASTADEVAAINDAVAKGVNVINLSIGGTSVDSAEQTAIQNALNQNVTVVAAAGNNGAASIEYPAAYSGVISVGATSLADGKPNGAANSNGTSAAPIEYVASYSNYGAGLGLVARAAIPTPAAIPTRSTGLRTSTAPATQPWAIRVRRACRSITRASRNSPGPRKRRRTSRAQRRFFLPRIRR